MRSTDADKAVPVATVNAVGVTNGSPANNILASNVSAIGRRLEDVTFEILPRLVSGRRTEVNYTAAQTFVQRYVMFCCRRQGFSPAVNKATGHEARSLYDL